MRSALKLLITVCLAPLLGVPILGSKRVKLTAKVDKDAARKRGGSKPRGRGSVGLSPQVRDELLKTLSMRFEKNLNRHQGIAWVDVKARLEANPAKLLSLWEMERTGGEPDIVGHDETTGEYIVCDCSAESPKGRRSFCYDREAWVSRKENLPANNAVDMAAAMGIDILTEEEYRELQTLGEFDTKTSSWVRTPVDIRKLGGALFCDRRYGRVFLYHNGAESYFASRGFRGMLRI